MQEEEALNNIYEELEAWQETLEILQDSELMEAIRKSIEALQMNDTVSLEEARQALGLA